jgi:integrase
MLPVKANAQPEAGIGGRWIDRIIEGRPCVLSLRKKGEPGSYDERILGEGDFVQAGGQDFTFHDLWPCFASHWVMGGADMATVKELLGHKTLTMTLRYAHLAPSYKVKAVNILDSTINKKSSAESKKKELTVFG